MKKNQIIDLEITDLSYEAMGVAHYEGMTVFVTNALPGEVVSAKILKVKKNFAFAKIEEIKKESPDRVKIKLNQWVQTGLASLAHIKYDKQLEFKRNQVVNLLKKAHLDEIEVGQTLPSPEQTGYRNKAQVPVREYNGQLEIGFFRRHSHDLVPLTNFFTTDPEIDRVLVAVRDVLRKYKIAPYDEVNNTGIIRYLDVRRSKANGEIMVILVSRVKDFVILGKKDYLVFGNDQITDQIGDLKFRISPQSFFQINSLQTPRLYDLAIKQADLGSDDVVIDAYSGIGTIGLSVAKHVKAVRGIEVVRDAIKDAKDNAELNGIENAKYYLGKAEEIMPRWAKKGMKTDVVFVDPPRKGLTPEFINATVKTGPKKVVYISCNPATMIRDLLLFQEQGYEFKRIDPVDMFPQTPHVEAVTVLTKKK